MCVKDHVDSGKCVFSMRDNPYTPDIYERGFAMDISNVRRNETSPFVYHKTMNYGDCILEKGGLAKLEWMNGSS